MIGAWNVCDITFFQLSPAHSKRVSSAQINEKNPHKL